MAEIESAVNDVCGVPLAGCEIISCLYLHTLQHSSNEMIHNYNYFNSNTSSPVFVLVPQKSSHTDG